jgi:hypothetical protein
LKKISLRFLRFSAGNRADESADCKKNGACGLAPRAPYSQTIFSVGRRVASEQLNILIILIKYP